MHDALAAALRAERAARKMTTKDLASKSGIPERSMIRYLEAERVVDMKVLAKFARGFGMKPSELLAEAERRAGFVAPDPPKSNPGNLDPVRDRLLTDVDAAPVPVVDTVARKRRDASR
jgi:transcriptional regulator with XRE-family HTH domain